jgi:hypothetical protein
MKKLHMTLALCLITIGFSGGLLGKSEEGHLEHAGINVRDLAAVQRGAKWYVNYCFSCHSAKYMRYNRLVTDLDLSEETVMENLVFSDAKIGDTMDIAMNPDQAALWLGKTPPDLSVIARSRGVDWLFTYLKTFYQDESAWNNLMRPIRAVQYREPAVYATPGQQAGSITWQKDSGRRKNMNRLFASCDIPGLPGRTTKLGKSYSIGHAISRLRVDRICAVNSGVTYTDFVSHSPNVAFTAPDNHEYTGQENNVAVTLGLRPWLYSTVQVRATVRFVRSEGVRRIVNITEDKSAAEDLAELNPYNQTPTRIVISPYDAGVSTITLMNVILTRP